MVFGSETKAILADPTVPINVDLAALDDFLTFTFMPSPQSLFEGVKKLPQGHLLRVTPDGITLERYCRQPGSLQIKSENEWLEELRTKIKAAVHRQMAADMPVGVILSGGVNSAAVATFTNSFLDQPIHTFTIGFAGEFAQNELVAARRSAELTGTSIMKQSYPRKNKHNSCLNLCCIWKNRWLLVRSSLTIGFAD